MKITALILVFVFVSVITAKKQIPSYLGFIGNIKYNKTETGLFTVKNYYLSQRISYSWNDAFISCRLAGMKLATIESDLEGQKLFEIAKENLKLFTREVLVDGKDLLEDQEASWCLAFYQAKNRKVIIRKVDCQEDNTDFLCEDIEVTDKFESLNEKQKDEKVDVKAKFFTSLGDYKNDSISKSYYLSQSYSEPISKSHQICESFNMILAAPQDQSEYDNLKKLSKKLNVDDFEAAISGYRSKLNDRLWLINGKEVNFVIDWFDGEPKPNKPYSDEHCYAMKFMGSIFGMNSFPCYNTIPFICEYDHTILESKQQNDASVDRFFEPLIKYKIDDVEKALFLAKDPMTFVKAKRACRSLGMELFVPETEREDTEIRLKLKEIENIPNRIFIGYSSRGSDGYFYSINSGKILRFDLPWGSSDITDEGCMYLKRDDFGSEYFHSVANCYTSEIRFVCQKTLEIEEATHSVSSTASWILSSSTTQSTTQSNYPGDQTTPEDLTGLDQAKT